MIVVTAATGHLGRLVVEALVKKVAPGQVVAGVRDAAKASGLAALGVQVRVADYTKPATLDAAFAGAEKVLLISSNELGQRATQHANAVAAARRAGVTLLAYTGVLHGERSKLSLAPEHVATEVAIRESGLPYVFLRNGWYTENYTEHLAQGLAQGALIGSAGHGRIAAATRADYAAAAVEVLTGAGHARKIYELAGAPFTMTELAAEVAKQSGKSIGYNDLPPEKYRAILLGAGLPAAYADLLVDADVGISKGELDDSSGELARLIGRPTTPLADAVRSALAKL